MWSRTSLRSSTATSFCSRSVVSGSLGNRIASSSTRTGVFRVSDARRSSGRCRSAARARSAGSRSPQATVTPRPAGVGSKRWSSRRSAFSSSGAGLPELGLRLADTERRGDDLVVERRHEHLDAVVERDSNSVQKVLLGDGRPRRHPRRRCAQLVDQLVDAGGGERRRGGGSADELLPGQPHARPGAADARACASSGSRCAMTCSTV